jgi:hypothetical protein
MVDLYRSGLQHLAGPGGGHAKHLQRHILRGQIRESEVMGDNGGNLNRELELDNEQPQLSLIELLDQMWEVD